jgi:hypothetical protein
MRSERSQDPVYLPIFTSRWTGIAMDVSQVSELPHTKVYDAINELHDCGLVDVLRSSPKRFRYEATLAGPFRSGTCLGKSRGQQPFLCATEPL